MATVKSSGFTVLGHRGAKAHAPENTLPSFLKAIELGATMTELDIHLSKDGEMVVMHDAAVDRTTNGHGAIADLTVAQLKQLDAGSWFHPQFAGVRVPLLREVIELVTGRILLNIEVKVGAAPYPGIIGKMADLLVETGMVAQTVVSSFHPEYLYELRRCLPEVEAALLCTRVDGVIEQAVAAGWAAIHPHHSSVTPDFIAAAHDAGLAVRAWNPNDQDTMRKLLAMGVDGIGTDNPERLLELLAQA